MSDAMIKLFSDMNKIFSDAGKKYEFDFRKEDEKDFISSDYCRECGGLGYFHLPHEPESVPEKEQCFTCEELHKQEIRADRMHDEMKGN